MIFDHGTHTEKPVGSAHGLHGSTPSSSIRRSNRATQVSRWIGSTTRHAATSGAHPRRCDPGTGGLAREIPAGDADGASVRAWHGREVFSGGTVFFSPLARRSSAPSSLSDHTCACACRCRRGRGNTRGSFLTVRSSCFVCVQSSWSLRRRTMAVVSWLVPTVGARV